MALRNETYRLAGMWAIMLSAPDQVEHMKFIIKAANCRRGLEIGTFTGYSALVMAEGLPDDGKLVCLEKSQDYAEVARIHWHKAGVFHKIDLKLGLACDTLDQMRREGTEPFDFCFIDGDKQKYSQYLEKVIPLIRPGGFVMVDNTLWMGKVIDPNVRATDP